MPLSQSSVIRIQATFFHRHHAHSLSSGSLCIAVKPCSKQIIHFTAAVLRPNAPLSFLNPSASPQPLIFLTFEFQALHTHLSLPHLKSCPKQSQLTRQVFIIRATATILSEIPGPTSPPPPKAKVSPKHSENGSGPHHGSTTCHLLSLTSIFLSTSPIFQTNIQK